MTTPSNNLRLAPPTRAVLMLLLVLGGLLASPDASYSSTSPGPTLEATVASPHVVRAGQSYEVWYRIKNTAFEPRSYWFAAAELSGVLTNIRWPDDILLSPGEIRFVRLTFTAAPGASTGTAVQLLLDAHAHIGDQYGYVRNILEIRIDNRPRAVSLIPVVPPGFKVIPGRNYRVWHTVTNHSGATQSYWFVAADLSGTFTNIRWPDNVTLASNESRRVYVDFTVPSTLVVGERRELLLDAHDERGDAYGYARAPLTVEAKGPEPAQFYGHAWTKESIGNPFGIGIQIAAQYESFLDDHQERVWVGWNGCTTTTEERVRWDEATTLDYVARHKGQGRLYVFLDEPGQGNGACDTVPPASYAKAYHRFVQSVLAIDPTARFSPAGFEQENSRPGPHSTQYAEEFVQAYWSYYRQAPPVDEWRFHVLDILDMSAWENEVRKVALWSYERRAPMTLGSFGFPHVLGSVLSQEEVILDRLKDQSWLNGLNGWIVSAAWWTYDISAYADTRSWPRFQHDLVRLNERGEWVLTPEGCTFVRITQGRLGPGC